MMDPSGKSQAFSQRVQSLSWWTFYGLFLILVFLLFTLMIRAVFGGALGRISNVAQFIYFLGLAMAVFGLMAMCIAYIARQMGERIRANRARTIPH